jgi:hypothetical protein
VRCSKLYGTYVALCYLTPLLGGWLADRYCGLFPMLFAGCVCITLGHALMVRPALSHAAMRRSAPTHNLLHTTPSDTIRRASPACERGLRPHRSRVGPREFVYPGVPYGRRGMRGWRNKVERHLL